MEQNKLEQSVLERIKQEDIQPKAKWTFLLHDAVIWSIGMLSVIVGALSFAVMLHMLRNNDWDLYEEISESLVGFILTTLPYFWILLLGLFMFIAYYQVQHTRRGYTYKFSTIILASVVVSVLLGSGMYAAGAGEKIDTVLTENVEAYDKYVNPHRRIWSQAEKGLLGGVIIEIEDDELELMDRQRREWHVDTKDAEVPRMFILKPGMMVKIIGEWVDDDEFEAHRILPANRVEGRKVIEHRMKKPMRKPLMEK